MRIARALRWLARAAAPVWLVAAVVPALSAEPEARTGASACTSEWRREAAHAFWWGDFDALEALHRRAGQGARDIDGASCQVHVRLGTNDVFEDSQAQRESYHAQLDALTLQWAQEHPHSGYAQALHAESLVSHAWFYRGKGYAKTVPAQAWSEFNRYTRQALDYLTANHGVAITDNETHRRLLNIARALGWPRDRLWAIVDDGLKRDPQDDGLYFVMLTNLLPKWGGSAVEVDRYITEVVSRTRAQRGMELYALLYESAADEEFDQSLFTQSGARWPAMKQGYDELTRRYPTPWRFNRYAYFACMAQDKEAYLVQMDEVGAQPDPKAWGSDPQRTIESCRRWGAAQ